MKIAFSQEKNVALRALMSLVFLSFLLSGCDSRRDQKLETNPAFGKYIFAYPSGSQSKLDPIRIVLADNYSGKLASNDALPENLFDFDPSIKGQTVWESANVLKFIPDAPLESGKIYLGTLHLKTLFPDIESELANFEFKFQTVKLNMSLHLDGLETPDPEDLSRMRLTGKIYTTDFVPAQDIEAGVKATQEGRDLPVKLISAGNKVFDLQVGEIQRGEDSSAVELTWALETNTETLGDQRRVRIPSLSEFSVTSVTIDPGSDQVVNVYFSDPIRNQRVESFVAIEGVAEIKTSLVNNVLKLYPQEPVHGTKLLQINGNIKNTAGHIMGSNYSKALVFELENPAVRILSDKSVLPTQKEGLLFPFEAVSLSGVDIYITKIFSNNILQYLQSGSFGESLYNMNRVGRHIYRKHLNLRHSGPANLNKWNRYYVDLSEVIKTDPGALYEVDIRFKQRDAYNICDQPKNTGNENLTTGNEGWISDGTYFVDDYWADYEYNWEEEDNPCHPAYYSRSNASVKKVVMASNLGLMAKMGSDHKLRIVVNDLKTTRPVQAANVIVYDYQQQVIADSHTDTEGFATITCSRKPFAILATTTNDRAYLKVDDGNALSLSKFDVSGSYTEEGVKGFIYGERGVWRPGDSLYLNFILEDSEHLIPDNHPVEMKLFNPMGREVKRMVKTTHVKGFYDFRTATEPDAPTGDYRMTVTIGNRTFTKNLKIETVKPNRLKIAFDFKTPAPGANQLSGTLEARWLHGADAPNLKASVDMTLQPKTTTFEGYQGYHFDNNLGAPFHTEEERIFDGKLDASGKAPISVNMKKLSENAPGMLRASFSTKVYEPGGNFSVDYYSIPYSPYKSYAGIRLPESDLWGNALEVDKPQNIELVSLTNEGKPSKTGELEVKLYRIDRYWWYDRYNGSTYNYIDSKYTHLIENRKIPLTGGKGNYTVTVDKNNWGQYLIEARDPESGHTSARLIYFDWPYWMRANRKDSEAPTILGFSSDKEVYNTGDSIKLTFPAPENGRALISIENGTKILRQYWVKTKKGETVTSFKATGEMAPNVYAHITLIQPFAQTANDRPQRMYGVIPLMVVNPDSRLEPVIRAPEVLRPESVADITVFENEGREMTYTLAVVDEGLLSLTRFKTPDPRAFFYAREALGVETWDMYDLIVGAFTENMGSLLRIGGDEEAINPNKQKAMRFKPVVRFLGPFTLPRGQKATHKVPIPNYVGSVRVMVVAGQNKAYGNAEKEIPVRSPLMVLGTLPRVLGPGEEVSLPVNVFAMESGVKDVTVEVSTNAMLSLEGTKSQNLTFAKTGDEVVYFKLKAAKNTGVGKVRIKARSGKNESNYEVELDVRAANPEYTVVRDTLIPAGGTWNPEFTYFGLDGTNRGTIELSKIPAINLEKRLRFLITYPHGCLEQITSGGFPQLYLSDITELSAAQKIEIERNVKAVLTAYRQYQLSDGGMGYWPGARHAQMWTTSYAGEFMIEAEKKGFALPVGLKSEWLRFQKAEARRWNSSERDSGWQQRTQAYRLYTLALAGHPDYGSMNVLKDQPGLDISAQWILALAYVQAGQSEVASRMVQGLAQTIPAYQELGHTFGSDVRDRGFVLKTLLALNKRSEAAPIAIKLAQKLGSDQWYSTQVLAYTLSSLAEFMAKSGDTGLQADITAGGKTENYMTGKNLIQQDLTPKSGQNKASVKNKSGQDLYARLILTGKPLEGKETAMAQGVSVSCRFMDNNFDPIAVKNLKMGTDFIAEVTITNPGGVHTIENMALTQIFPSGWEILNPRMDLATGDDTGVEITYQDIRDDRVMTYFDLPRNKPLKIRIRLNATYKGRFYMPAVKCSAMYDESIQAIIPGEWVEVTD